MTLPKPTIYLFCLLLTNASFGQADFKFSIESLQKDFAIMRSALEESHAGIYWYRSKSEMDNAFNEAYKSLDHEMTELEFFRILAPLISKIGCGHTWIATTETTQEKIWSKGKVLPLTLKFLDGKAYCFQNNSHDSTSIQPGDQILSINNYGVDSLLGLANKFSPGDGFIEVGKWRILDKVFNQFFTLYLAQPDEYRIGIRKSGGEEAEILIEPLTLKEIESISQRRHAKENNIEKRNIILSFLEDSSSALLGIREFSDWRTDGRRIQFEDELKKYFQKIDSSGRENLIIDLRDNDGGNEKYGLSLFSCLTDKPFIGYKQIDFRTTRFSFRKYSTTGWLEYKLFKTLLRHKKVNDSTYLLTNNRATSVHEPIRKAFKGNIYVLINRGSFSTTSDIAALLHSKRMATFIGEETGGSYLGNTSNYSFLITLPDTKIKVNIPVSRYQTNVLVNNNFGRGTMPDHKIQYSIDDMINGVDQEMNAVLTLIKREPKRTGRNK